jgi:hypothetical protein
LYIGCKIGDMPQQPNVYMQTLTEREARAVAAMLKRTGYSQATIEECRKKSPLEIAAYFQPINEVDRLYLTQAIAQAAGLVPKEKKGK